MVLVAFIAIVLVILAVACFLVGFSIGGEEEIMVPFIVVFLIGVASLLYVAVDFLHAL